MDDLAVMDDVVDDVVDGAADDNADTGEESGADETEGAEGQGAKESDSPYTTKFSREMRAALKQWEQANPEASRYAKQARDNHARLFALTQLEPKGIDGVRERYALLDSLTHGEVKGHEALTAIQEELAAVEEVDNLLASGNPKAFDALGDDFNEGLAKLAPAYLDRVMKSDPAAFEAAVMPHFVSMLAGSDIVKHFNSLVDVLNTNDDPRLDDKSKMAYAISAISKMAQEFNGLQQKAGTLATAKPGNTNDRTQFEQERSALDEERQTLHWDTKIKPGVATHENKTFDTLFDPYQKRLKLDAGAKADLTQAFKSALNRAGSADAAYMAQMKIYRKQRNPDPVAVANFVKNSINKHAKPVMESLIKARYGSFLGGKQKTATQTAKPGVKQGPVSPNVEIRTVKPPMSEIDHKNTPIDWLAQKKYRLYSGKVVQVRAAQ